ncbi:MAG: hypothetical protein ACTTG8_03335 [Catonella sp.]|uniref:hypothetical protein n=1 Tax=Catonella sp. TaxID=2382125 RepID=UPI003FA07775
MKKESILDEEAYIYRHNDNEDEGDKWKRMSRKQKWAYFNDYYRNKLIGVVILLAVIVFLVYSMLKPKPDVVVSIAVLNDYWNNEKVEELTKEIGKYLELEEGKQEIWIDDTYFLKETGIGNEIANTQRLVARFATGDINVVIAERPTFEEYVKNGTFLKISEVLDDVNLYRDKIVSDGYGISLDGTNFLKEVQSYQKESVLGVLANADNEDYKYLSKIIKYILQKS